MSQSRRQSVVEDRSFVNNPLTQIDSCFDGAGEEESLEIWWVKHAELEEWPCAEYGKFDSNTSYLLLATQRDSKDALTWNVHYWIGQNAPLDAKFVGALKAVELHRHLQHQSVQHREEQGKESDEFLLYFPHANIQIVSTGSYSILTSPQPHEHDKRLYHIKGKRYARVKLVPLEVESLNSGDAFILDAGPIIYSWIGADANIQERARCLQLATRLRLGVKGCANTNRLAWRRPQCDLVTIFQNSKTVVGKGGHVGDYDDKEFWWEFGKRTKRTTLKVASGADGGSDDKAEMDAVMDLYQIEVAAAANSEPQIDFVERDSKGRLSASVFQSHLVFLLDCDTQLFVWIGRTSTSKARSTALQMAHDSLTQFQRPMKNTPITTLFEHLESPLFTLVFDDWGVVRKDVTLPTFVPDRVRRARYVPGDNDAAAAIAAMLSHAPTTASARVVHPIQEDVPGSGELHMYRVEHLDLVPVDDLGIFDSGYSYICLYSFMKFGRLRHMIYYWEGLHCPASSWLAWYFDLSPDLIEGLAEDGVQPISCRAPMLNEPEHFLDLFKETQMIIFNGNSSFPKGLSCLLFQISSSHYRFGSKCDSKLEHTLTLQVQCKASSLSSLHAFVLVRDGVDGARPCAYIWHGSCCDGVERAVAKKVYSRLTDMEAVVVSEGREPTEFWDTIAPNMSREYYRVPKLLGTRFKMKPLVFRARRTGLELKMEALNDYSPQDFSPTDVVMLLMYGRLHLWEGRHVNEDTKRMARSLAKELIRQTPSITSIIDEQDGNESSFLRSVLPLLDHKAPLGDPYEAKERRLMEMGVQGRVLSKEEYEPSERDKLFWLRW